MPRWCCSRRRFTGYLADGAQPGRCGQRGAVLRAERAFETADGWIMVAAYMPKRWEKLCRLLGLAQLLSDPRFATSPLRVATATPWWRR